MQKQLETGNANPPNVPQARLIEDFFGQHFTEQYTTNDFSKNSKTEHCCCPLQRMMGQVRRKFIAIGDKSSMKFNFLRIFTIVFNN